MTIDFTRDLALASEATLAAALQEASVPTLLLCLVHITGNTDVLDGSLRPAGVYINEFQGFMPEEDKECVRQIVLQALRDFRAGGCQLPPPPDAATLHRMMNFLVAQEVPADYVPMMLEELELDGEDARAQHWGSTVSAAQRERLPVLVIGGGMSGVLAAIRLAEAGIPFTVVEKNASVGGTWFENRYPGARVDVANHLYCYSFEPAHHWSEYFSRQKELQAYFEGCVDQHDLWQHFRFNTEVTGARFEDGSGEWTVQLRESDGSSSSVRARVVISAVGQLNRPFTPEIPGADLFAGITCHTAGWENSLDVAGKRIAVVGSGASAFQLVPEIATSAGQLTVFQRSAPWMFENPAYHDAVSEGKRWCLQHIPSYARWFRFLIFWPAIDGAWETVVVDADWPHQERSVNEANDFVRQMFTDYISGQISGDKALLDKVIPDYAPMGKRTLQDNGSWLAALQRDNVELVNQAVTRIGEHSVFSADGTEHPVDAIIYATGFRANEFLSPMDIRGRENQSLAEHWGDEAAAYLGITVPGFPNFFLMYGPGTNLAFGGSLIFNGECQMRYIMDSIRLLLESDCQTIECKHAAFDAYQQRFREQHAKMIWEHDSIDHSFYRNDRGKCTLLWPWKILEMWQRTRSVDAGDYTLS